MGEIYSNENSGKAEPTTKSLTVLDSYGVNISKLAQEKKLDPVFGRDEEILQIIQILGRRKKNNPVLVGEPGVGKCVTGKAEIQIRNKETGEVEIINIHEFIKKINL